MFVKFLEFKSSEKDFKVIKSFYLKDNLNSKIWNEEMEINEEVKESLLKIANDYIEHLDIGEIEIDDIVLTGSLANYNWSEYSDFDLHIVFDFKQINEDVELVQKYLVAAGKLWNEQHDILILGYEVELYGQNSSEKHISSGQFSLLNNEWIKKPSKEDFTPDEDLIKRKAQSIMDRIDDVEIDFENHYSYKELAEKVNKILKKIKDNRQKGLNEEGEFSTENLVFKLMRRNGYIKKLIDLKNKIYDKQFK
jgi:predicted nucleotidyltransferase